MLRDGHPDRLRKCSCRQDDRTDNGNCLHTGQEIANSLCISRTMCSFLVEKAVANTENEKAKMHHERESVWICMCVHVVTYVSEHY